MTARTPLLLLGVVQQRGLEVKRREKLGLPGTGVGVGVEGRVSTVTTSPTMTCCCDRKMYRGGGGGCGGRGHVEPMMFCLASLSVRGVIVPPPDFQRIFLCPIRGRMTGLPGLV